MLDVVPVFVVFKLDVLLDLRSFVRLVADNLHVPRYRADRYGIV